MPISYTYNLVFIHVPKCAGTTIEKIIGTSTHKEYYCRWDEKPKDSAKTLQHYTYLELKKDLKIKWDDYYIFSVVRNPYERFVSEYKFRKSIYLKHKKTKQDPGSFSEFIENLSIKKNLRIPTFDAHLETQTSFLQNKSEKIEKSISIFKFENLKTCWDKLEQKTGVLYKDNYWSRKAKDNIHYQDFYTPKTKAIIYDFYKEDFDNFGYSQKLPSKNNI